MHARETRWARQGVHKSIDWRVGCSAGGVRCCNKRMALDSPGVLRILRRMNLGEERRDQKKSEINSHQNGPCGGVPTANDNVSARYKFFVPVHAVAPLTLCLHLP